MQLGPDRQRRDSESVINSLRSLGTFEEADILPLNYSPSVEILTPRIYDNTTLVATRSFARGSG
jgi:hypothetical protein